MKVRIGNDICLHVTLLGDEGMDYINIKSIRAFIVNTSKQHELDVQRRYDSVKYHDEIEDRRGVVKYISRFPAEPHCRPYHGTPFDLMHCGHPTFHVHPIWGYNPYCGFGIRPHTFDPFHNHLWGCDDMMDLHDKMLMKDEDYKEQYGRLEFMAPVMATEQPNTVDVHFPAENQIFTGTYKLIIVAKLYEPGYGKNNLRTVTMDYQDIFTLVGSSDEDGLSGNVTISVGNTMSISDIVVQGEKIVKQGDAGVLYAEVVPASVGETGVTWEITGDNLNYLKIERPIGNTLVYKAKPLPEGEDSAIAYITVRSVKDPNFFRDIAIKIVADASAVASSSSSDKYVTDGKYNDGKTGLELTLSDGSTATVDTTPETQWYENNN